MSKTRRTCEDRSRLASMVSAWHASGLDRLPADHSSTKARKTTGLAPHGSAGPRCSSWSASYGLCGTVALRTSARQSARPQEPELRHRLFTDSHFRHIDLFDRHGVAALYQELLVIPRSPPGSWSLRGLGQHCGHARDCLSLRTDRRAILLTFGFVLFAVTTLYMGSVTTEISPGRY